MESSEAQVTSRTCVTAECHQGWLDNNPPESDVATRNATLDYLPMNLNPKASRYPFYGISAGYFGSIHSIPSFDPNTTDYVGCLGCHKSLQNAHSGPLPATSTCGGCHRQPFFDFNDFLASGHSNSNRTPLRFFDQLGNGTTQAIAFQESLGEPLPLFRADKKTPVTKNQRIEECSVCHNPVLESPRHKRRIAQGNFPSPQVGCPACHTSHIPAPRGDQLAKVDSTVSVSSISGTTVLAVTPEAGREVAYKNLKPYKLDATGAKNFRKGRWDGGSLYARPNRTIISGNGTVSDGAGASTRFTFSVGGFLKRVMPHYTLFISGSAQATATLPAAAVNAGSPVALRADLDMAPFDIISVIDDNTLEISPGVVATRNVTYVRATPPPATGNLSVSIPFSGNFAFEIRDMNTDSETLCGSCHTQSKFKFTAWGKSSRKNTFIDLKRTHNKDILTEWRTSGHANREAPPFAEFSAREFGTSHVTTYPFDMSITGSGGTGTLRNKGNTTYTLTQTPDPNNAYLGVAGNASLPVLINNYACFQCHNGAASINYLKDIQGTAEASVVWGDATVTCYTCHDTHAEGAGKNVRIPVKLSYNSRFVDATTNPRGGINKFLDGTDIPSNAGTGIICLFCHQGRESGLTVYRAIRTANSALDPYTDPGTVISASGINFTNPHYLESGAILWSKNAWEYFFGGTAQEYYSGIPAHQELNCAGCHMTEASPDGLEGGHTFRPSVETCKQCHGQSITSFASIPAVGDYDGDGTVETAFEEIGTLGDAVLGDSGLFGRVKAALAAQGITYNPDSYPYFFNDAGGSFTAWTTNTLSAAFNLSYFFKSGGCVPYHNAFYGAQILQDSLRALGVDTTSHFRGPTNRTATDYRTIAINP